MNSYQAAVRVTVETEEAATVFLRFAGQMFEPLVSGALWWPAEQTLLVADLHLDQ